MKDKNENNVSLTVVLVIVCVLGLGLGCLLLFNYGFSGSNNDKENEVREEKDTSKKDKDKTVEEEKDDEPVEDDKNLSGLYLRELSFHKSVDLYMEKEYLLLIASSTCYACTIYKPVLDKVLTEEKLIGYYIDVNSLTAEELEELKSVVNYTNTPTTTIIYRGKERNSSIRLVGSVDEKTIKDWLLSTDLLK